MTFSRYLTVGSMGLVLALGAAATTALGEEPEQLKRGEKKELLRDEHADHATKPPATQAAPVKKKSASPAAVSADAKAEAASSRACG